MVKQDNKEYNLEACYELCRAVVYQARRDRAYKFIREGWIARALGIEPGDFGEHTRDSDQEASWEATMIEAYKLILFDLEGTLVPSRSSEVVHLERRLLHNVRATYCHLPRSCYRALITDQRQLLYSFDLRLAFDAFLDWLRGQLPNLWRVWVGQHDWQLKPSPALIHAAMTELARFDPVESDEVLLVGDGPEDQEAAEAAGIDFVWAKDFFGWNP